jgi:hypothetical protein
MDHPLLDPVDFRAVDREAVQCSYSATVTTCYPAPAARGSSHPTHGGSRMAEPTPPTPPLPYEPPRIERVFTPEHLAQEVLYAGLQIVTITKL